MKRLLTCLLAVTVMLLSMPTVSAAAIENYTELFTAATITDENNNSMNYQYYVPTNYESSKAYPLVVFLHGAGERGTDNMKQLTASSMMPHYFTKENMEKYPCIILAPQCPIGKTWANATLGDKWGECFLFCR